GGVEHCLRGDAADVEAGAAERFAALGAGGLQAQLGGADRGDVAAGAGADDEDVVVVGLVGHSGLAGDEGYGRHISLPRDSATASCGAAVRPAGRIAATVTDVHAYRALLAADERRADLAARGEGDRKSTRLNSSHVKISY